MRVFCVTYRNPKRPNTCDCILIRENLTLKIALTNNTKFLDHESKRLQIGSLTIHIDDELIRAKNTIIAIDIDLDSLFFFFELCNPIDDTADF